MAYRHPFRRWRGPMPVILNRQQNTAGPVPKQKGDRARTRVFPPFGFLPRRGCVRPNRPVWARTLFWPGFHIRMNVYMQVNENPGEKLQSLSKKDEFIWLGFP